MGQLQIMFINTVKCLVKWFILYDLDGKKLTGKTSNKHVANTNGRHAKKLSIATAF